MNFVRGGMTMLPENMNITICSLTIVLLLMIILLVKKRGSKFYKYASKIPGPTTIPILGNALEFLSLNMTEITYKFIEIMQKYDGTSRIWLGNELYVLVSDPKDVQIVLTSSKLVGKNDVYKFFEPTLGKGLLTASGNIWRKHRKIITPTFQTPVLKHFFPIFKTQADILVRRLKNEFHSTKDVFPYLRDCTMDLIAETALEYSFKAQSGTISKQLEASQRMMELTFDRIFKVWLHPEQIYAHSKSGKEYENCKQIVMNFANPLIIQQKEHILKQIQKDKKEDQCKQSFIRTFVSFNNEGEQLSDKELCDEVLTIVITGYETAASTLSFFLVTLGIHQNIQEKLYNEIMEMEEKIKGRQLEIEDVQSLQYLDMVYKEVLRLYPLAAIIFRKASADVPLATCTIPEGASVALVILHTHRDPKYWKDPLEFNPERFLPGAVEEMHPYSYIPFSAGPRGCIGKKYADLAVKTIICKVIKEFRINSSLKQSEVDVTIAVTLKMSDGFKISLEPRNST